MTKWQKLKESRDAIVEDMLSCITYLPNRELDLLAFMEWYQKANGEQRPFILNHLRNCMDGKDYPNPYEGSYRYSQSEVEVFEKILDQYIEKLARTGEKPILIANCVKEVVDRIHVLHENCGGVLMDSWRRERVCTLIHEGATLAGLDTTMDCTLSHRMW